MIVAQSKVTVMTPALAAQYLEAALNEMVSHLSKKFKVNLPDIAVAVELSYHLTCPHRRDNLKAREVTQGWLDNALDAGLGTPSNVNTIVCGGMFAYQLTEQGEIFQGRYRVIVASPNRALADEVAKIGNKVCKKALRYT